MEAQEPQSPAESIDTGVGPSNQGKTIPEGSSLKIRIPAFKPGDSHPIPAAEVQESTVAGMFNHSTSTLSIVINPCIQSRKPAHRQLTAPVQPTTAATPSCTVTLSVPQLPMFRKMSNTIEQRIEDLERWRCELEALHIRVYGRPLGDDLIDLFGPLADETRVDRTAG
ncbi:hypothetical protein BKA82DRAFT_28788 [Pisolithus tinctorius]|nr:hypothetical protein BKA82DRAFT_28788 [Pisolithus tinctorius]